MAAWNSFLVVWNSVLLFNPRHTTAVCVAHTTGGSLARKKFWIDFWSLQTILKTANGTCPFWLRIQNVYFQRAFERQLPPFQKSRPEMKRSQIIFSTPKNVTLRVLSNPAFGEGTGGRAVKQKRLGSTRNKTRGSSAGYGRQAEPSK